MTDTTREALYSTTVTISPMIRVTDAGPTISAVEWVQTAPLKLPSFPELFSPHLLLLLLQHVQEMVFTVFKSELRFVLSSLTEQSVFPWPDGPQSITFISQQSNQLSPSSHSLVNNTSAVMSFGGKMPSCHCRLIVNTASCLHRQDEILLSWSNNNIFDLCKL